MDLMRFDPQQKSEVARHHEPLNMVGVARR